MQVIIPESGSTTYEFGTGHERFGLCSEWSDFLELCLLSRCSGSCFLRGSGTVAAAAKAAAATIPLFELERELGLSVFSCILLDSPSSSSAERVAYAGPGDAVELC